MPKDQACLSEHSPRAVSSKTAKDKSNSTTLLAMRSTKGADDSGGRHSRCSSEKDSGYSDGSDWQQTDVEDQRSNKSKYRCSERAEALQPGQNQEPGQGKPGNPSREVPPFYIIKNMAFEQPDAIQTKSQLPRRNRSKEVASSGSAHMILLQQPILLPATLQLHKPLFQKSSATGKKIKDTYLPILNSYPRIAPHPSKKPPDKSSLNDESQNQSKRVCTEHKSEGTPVSRSLPKQHLNKQPKLAVVTPGLPSSSTTRNILSSSGPSTASSSQGPPSESSLSSASSRALHRNGTTSSRHRRFLNTVEILRQSGLLDITLRTKELLRQSKATEQDIAQLRRHTELLCQAASDPGRGPSSVWEELHQAMAESGNYPSLKTLKDLPMPCYPDSASRQERVSNGGANGSLAAESSEVPPSRLVTTLPHPHQNCPVPRQSHSGQGRELGAGYKSSEEVTFMPPDSSTG